MSFIELLQAGMAHSAYTSVVLVLRVSARLFGTACLSVTGRLWLASSAVAIFITPAMAFTLIFVWSATIAFAVIRCFCALNFCRWSRLDQQVVCYLTGFDFMAEQLFNFR